MAHNLLQNVKKYVPQGFIHSYSKAIHAIKLVLLKKKEGNHTYIDKSVHVTGWKSISIGDYTVVSEDTWINVNKRIPNFIHIKIGNNCYVGRRNFFNSGKQIVIGDYFMSGLECKILCADHIENPHNPYITTGVTDNKSIIIGTNVWLGAGVIIIGNVTIGSGSIIGAGALVNKDIPPFSLVVGNPFKIIKRYSFAVNKWLRIDEISSEAELLLPDEASYCETLRTKRPKVYIPLQAASKKQGDMF